MSDTSSSNVRGSKLHILVVSFPAFGHIVPMLELAKKISAFHTVTFAVSAGKIGQIGQRELIGENDHITVLAIHDDVTEDFDEIGAKGDDAAMHTYFDTIFASFTILFKNMPTKQKEGRLQTGISRPVDAVIIVNFASEPAAVCRERGVPYYLFNPENSVLLQNIASVDESTPTITGAGDEDNTFWRLAEAGGPPVPMVTFVRDLFIRVRKTMHLASGMIINSFRELDRDALHEVVKNPALANLAYYCVGPLFPPEKAETSICKQEMEKKLTAWLDRQDINSVIYVSFGSIVLPTPEQVKIIGLALLALGRPFVWSLRKHQEFLPEGMTSTGCQPNTNAKFLVIPWAPQKLILAHPAVALYFSHCGWNSTLEGLSNGLPFVAWPMFADQMLNAQLIVKLGVGVLIPGTGLKVSRVVPMEEIVDVVEEVAGWKKEIGVKKGNYRQVARGWGEKISGTWAIPTGSSYREFTELVKFSPTHA